MFKIFKTLIFLIDTKINKTTPDKITNNKSLFKSEVGGFFTWIFALSLFWIFIVLFETEVTFETFVLISIESLK